MPPPSLPPVVIPQNNNPMPTVVTTPGSAVSPGSGGGVVRRAAPEPNKRALYVGGLDPRVTEDVLNQIFETTGHVQSVKIIPDKNVSSKGLNYGFIEYDDPASAQRAMDTLNGRRVHQSVSTTYSSRLRSDPRNRRFESTGPTNRIVTTKKTPRTISIFSSATLVTRSTTRSFCKPFLLLDLSQKLGSCGI